MYSTSETLVTVATYLLCTSCIIFLTPFNIHWFSFIFLIIWQLLWATPLGKLLVGFSSTSNNETTYRTDPIRRLLRLSTFSTGFFAPFIIKDSPNIWASSFGTVGVIMSVLLMLDARRTMGAQYQGAVEIRPEHKLVQTRAYAYVRHPIYTGVFALLFTSTLLISSFKLISVCTSVYTFHFITRKIHEEEKLLGEKFGSVYTKYKAKVQWRIIPLVY